MNSRALVRMISFVVKEELKKQLQPMVEKVLTEQYLRRVIQEQSPVRKISLREEETENYEDHIPEQEPMDDGGIYHEDNPNTGLRQSTNENVRKLLSPENPWSSLYEGVQPLNESTNSAVGEVPLSMIQKKMGVDFNKMRELAGVKKIEAVSVPEAPRRHRPEWDQVVDTRPEHMRDRPAIAPPRRSVMPPLNPTNAESAAFPDRPIGFDD